VGFVGFGLHVIQGAVFMNDISRWPIVVLVLFGAVASSCDLPGPAGTDHSPTASFVTLLGADTVAVEQFRRTPSGMEADVVLRTPRTSLWHYEIALTDGGQLVRINHLQRFKLTVYDVDCAFFSIN